MGRAILITALVVIAFAAILVARMPATWVVPSPPSKVACSSTDGTVWSGSCTGLTVQGQPVGDVTWELHAAALLAGKVAAHVTIARAGAGTAETDLESGFSGKKLTLHGLKAVLQPDRALLELLNSDMSGTYRLDLARAQIEDGNLVDVQGHIEAQGLYQTGGTPDSLGSYTIDFPGGSNPPKGKLRDKGGPLSVEGEVTVEPQGHVMTNALVAPRPSADPSLVNELKLLGTPDAQGRRPYAREDSFF